MRNSYSGQRVRESLCNEESADNVSRQSAQLLSTGESRSLTFRERRILTEEYNDLVLEQVSVRTSYNQFVE